MAGLSLNVDADAFSDRLLPGERLLWTGRPATGLRFRLIDAYLLPFGIIWIGAVGWVVAGVLWGSIFVALGVMLAWGRFRTDAWLRERTRYALTDRRLLILMPAGRATLTAVTLDRLPEARLTEEKDGRGTIRFGQPSLLTAFVGYSGLPSLDGHPQFLAIPEARRVFDLVQHAAARR